MKRLIYLLAALVLSATAATCQAQRRSYKDLKPIGPASIGETFDFSPEAIANFDDDGGLYENIYDILGQGCSFYCACAIGTQKASSTLAPQAGHNYAPANAHDLSFETAWVEGAPHNGVGEWIEYTLPPENPLITSICVANGYVRTKKAWTENNRVKLLEVRVDGRPHALLKLSDVYALQVFDVPPIGHTHRSNYEALTKKAPVVIRFIIRDVYRGSKYNDTAITEIFFDGAAH